MAQAPVYSPIHASEPIIWSFFINKGYTKEQTAGIMGNLWQESRFNTVDGANGVGLAQWIGQRYTRLLQREEPYSLNTQLEYIAWELSDPMAELSAGNTIRGAQTVEVATKLVMSLYERCHPDWCMGEQRIQFAQGFYERNK